MATQIGPKIGIEGEKEYRDALKQIINETKNLDAAMQKTASEWTANTSAMTKNKAIAQNLVQQIDNQKQKLSVMNQMLEESARKFGENAEATKSWQRAVDTATASLNNMESELKSLHGAEGISDMATKLADVGTTMQNMGANLARVGGVMSAAITAPLTMAGKKALELGSNLEESANKVDVVFGGMSESVKAFAATTTDAYAISEGKALEMAGDYGALATSMGFSEREAAKLSTEMVALAGDMASFHNKSVEVAANSLKGVFTGETEALKGLNVVMTQSTLEEYAARQGKVYSQMSQAEKVMTRYNYLLENQQDAIGDAGRTMDGFAGSTRQLQAAFDDAAAALGEALIPIITPIIQAITKMLQVFSELPSPIQKVIAVFGLLVAVIGPVLLIVGTLMMSLGGIITNAPIIAGALGTVSLAAKALAASFVELTVSAAPWLLLAAAIAAAGYLIYSNWDSISAAAENLASSFTGAVSKLDSFKSALADLAMDMARSLLDKIKELPEKIAAELREAIAKIKEVFRQMVAEAKKSGKDMVDGFIEGIKSKISKVVEAVKKVANTVKEFLGFSEPEKGPLSNFHTFAPDMMKLFAQGINQNKGIVTRALDSLAKEIAIPLDTSASMNMAIAGVDGGYSLGSIGGTTMNVYVDHINDIEDLIRIQSQAQQRYRMGAR